ncbi:MAG: FAD-dependent oxidoreductase [Candidatus Aminicenantes bacterium]|nr:FAD-dependent oxidoreductase [Candidatus Aminicenantes bacterium]
MIAKNFERSFSVAKNIKIIGAGISGLCAGCYLQMNGYDTEIFEMNSVPGGLCTSWERKGYTIDGCIHWLVGSSPSNKLYHLWNELIDMKKLDFVDFKEYLRVEDRDGQVMRVPTDIDELEQEWLDKAPEDKALIMEFTKAVRKFVGFEMPAKKAPELYSPWDGIKMVFQMLPYWRPFKKWISISTGDYMKKFKNPLLKNTLRYMFIPEMSVLFLIFTLAWMHQKSAGYPIGGSLNFARLIEKKYLDSGGKIHYGSKVEKIITENDRACGIELQNKEIHPADIVISAADGHTTIFNMLKGKYTDQKIEKDYQNLLTFPSYLQISLGVARTFEDAPHHLYFPLTRPLELGDGTRHDHIGVRVFNFDPILSPKGKTLLIVLLTTDNHTFWQELRDKDISAYKAKKKEIADQVIHSLDQKFGGIRSHLDVTDVSTPATVIRYTNNWKGSFEGWLLTPETGMKNMKKTLPGLENFYLIGQWVEPGGGVPTALMSGRNVAQIICKKHKKEFETQT